MTALSHPSNSLSLEYRVPAPLQQCSERVSSPEGTGCPQVEESVDPFKPGALAVYAGAYFNDDLATQYSVGAKDGKPFIRHFRRGDAELMPHPAHIDRFMGDMGTVQFVWNSSGRIDGFDFVGENLGKLRFARKPSASSLRRPVRQSQ